MLSFIPEVWYVILEAYERDLHQRANVCQMLSLQIQGLGTGGRKVRLCITNNANAGLEVTRLDAYHSKRTNQGVRSGLSSALEGILDAPRSTEMRNNPRKVTRRSDSGKRILHTCYTSRYTMTALVM